MTWPLTRHTGPGLCRINREPSNTKLNAFNSPRSFSEGFFFFCRCATTFNYEMSNILISVSLVKPAYQMQCSVNYLGTNCPLHIVKIVDLVASITSPEDRWLIIMKLTILIIFQNSDNHDYNRFKLNKKKRTKVGIRIFTVSQIGISKLGG